MLAVLERYYDGVPRVSATVEDFGALTLFVPLPGSVPFAARPTLGYTGDIDPALVAAVRARQRELELPETFEWVEATAPALAGLLAEPGVVIRRHPLLVRDAAAAVPPRANYSTRVLGADDSDVTRALAAADLAFGAAGTDVGNDGQPELAALSVDLETSRRVARTRARIRNGHAVLVAAYDAAGRLVATGQHNPLGAVTEIVGVGTLPAARRRGAGAAVTAALVADAQARGIETVFLAASDDTVARLYRRLGFVDVGTAMAAEPPATPS